ncbi:hypothetical protein D3C81_721650 [compost metagenome]
MLAGTPGHTLQLQGHVPDFTGVFVALEEVTQDFFLLVGLLQGHAHFEGDHLRQAVGQAVGLALHPRHVAHHRLGGHGTEGDDLAHRITAVGLGHVVDHPVTAVHAEVDVEVGHGNTFRVEEALEQQVVGQRVEVGDLQHIGHQRTGTRTPPRANRHAVVLGPLDEVHNDQEVTGEAHLDDDVQLELQAVQVNLTLFFIIGRGLFRPQHGQALFQAFVGHMPQVVVDAHAVGRGEVRQEVLAQLHLDVAALGNLDGVGDGVGQVAEELGHFLGRLQVLLVAVATRTARVIEGPALTDTDAGFVGVKVRLLDETYVVGSHQRGAKLVGQCHRRVHVFFVACPIGALHFNIEALGEHAHPVLKKRFGFVLPTRQQRHANVAFLARGQGNQALAGRGDPFTLEDDQAIALAIGPAARDQFGEVAIALGVHGQEADARQRGFRIGTGQPQVGTADRFDAGAHGRLVELHQRAHVALIGDRDRRHVHPGQRLGQRFDPHQAVDQREFGVDAQVNEGNRHGRSCSSA